MKTIIIKRCWPFANHLREYLERVHKEAGALSFIETESWFRTRFEVTGSKPAIDLLIEHMVRDGL